MVEVILYSFMYLSSHPVPIPWPSLIKHSFINIEVSVLSILRWFILCSCICPPHPLNHRLTQPSIDSPRHPSIHLHICPSFCPYPSVQPSTFLFIHLYIHLYILPLTHSPAHRPSHPSIYSSIQLSILLKTLWLTLIKPLGIGKKDIRHISSLKELTILYRGHKSTHNHTAEGWFLCHVENCAMLPRHFSGRTGSLCLSDSENVGHMWSLKLRMENVGITSGSGPYDNRELSSGWRLSSQFSPRASLCWVEYLYSGAEPHRGAEGMGLLRHQVDDRNWSWVSGSRTKELGYGLVLCFWRKERKKE